MIRFTFRLIGLFLLAAAFILVVYDGTKSIAGNTVYFTSVETVWQLLSPGTLSGIRPLIEPYAGGVLWNPGMVTVLAAPGWALLGLVGIIFVLLGRRRKPLIGYARP